MIFSDYRKMDKERVGFLINKERLNSYDTTPARPIDTVVDRYMQTQNETEEIEIKDDLEENESFNSFLLDGFWDSDEFSSIDRRIIKSVEDSFNFNETVRLIAKEENDSMVSLLELFRKMKDDTSLQNKFIEYYRAVRKEKVKLLMEGLLGKRKISLVGSEDEKRKKLEEWINFPRRKKELPEMKIEEIETIRDFQKAYMDAFTPL